MEGQSLGLRGDIDNRNSPSYTKFAQIAPLYCLYHTCPGATQTCRKTARVTATQCVLQLPCRYLTLRKSASSSIEGPLPGAVLPIKHRPAGLKCTLVPIAYIFISQTRVNKFKMCSPTGAVRQYHEVINQSHPAAYREIERPITTLVMKSLVSLLLMNVPKIIIFCGINAEQSILFS